MPGFKTPLRGWIEGRTRIKTNRFTGTGNVGIPLVENCFQAEGEEDMCHMWIGGAGR